MITLKEVMQNPCLSSPDGRHWEPHLHTPYLWRNRLIDAWHVLNGKATAVRQTSKKDLDVEKVRYGISAK